MSKSLLDRRTLLKTALAGLVALPAAGLVREAAAQAALPHLSEKDPAAVALGYVNDSKTVDAAKNPMHKAGADCANCIQLMGKEGDEWRPCNLFPGKLVHKDGWCKVWALKPGAKL